MKLISLILSYCPEKQENSDRLEIVDWRSAVSPSEDWQSSCILYSLNSYGSHPGYWIQYCSSQQLTYKFSILNLSNNNSGYFGALKVYRSSIFCLRNPIDLTTLSLVPYLFRAASFIVFDLVIFVFFYSISIFKAKSINSSCSLNKIYFCYIIDVICDLAYERFDLIVSWWNIASKSLDSPNLEEDFWSD